MVYGVVRFGISEATRRTARPSPKSEDNMTTKKGARRPDDDYPVVELKGYAATMRARRADHDRDTQMAREISHARNDDVAGMDELVKRMNALGRAGRRH